MSNKSATNSSENLNILWKLMMHLNICSHSGVTCRKYDFTQNWIKSCALVLISCRLPRQKLYLKYKFIPVKCKNLERKTVKKKNENVFKNDEEIEI